MCVYIYIYIYIYMRNGQKAASPPSPRKVTSESHRTTEG